MNGRDAFHRVRKIRTEYGDAVERVPTSSLDLYCSVEFGVSLRRLLHNRLRLLLHHAIEARGSQAACLRTVICKRVRAVR